MTGPRRVRRMPRIQVDVPDELYQELKRRDLPASEIFQKAVALELDRHRALDAMDDHLSELLSEVGAPTPDEVEWARAVVARISSHLDDES